MLQELPHEVVVHFVLQYLTPIELLNLSLACQSYYHTIFQDSLNNDEIVWRNQLINHKVIAKNTVLAQGDTWQTLAQQWLTYRFIYTKSSMQFTNRGRTLVSRESGWYSAKTNLELRPGYKYRLDFIIDEIGDDTNSYKIYVGFDTDKFLMHPLLISSTDTIGSCQKAQGCAINVGAGLLHLPGDNRHGNISLYREVDGFAAQVERDEIFTMTVDTTRGRTQNLVLEARRQGKLLAKDVAVYKDRKYYPGVSMIGSRRVSIRVFIDSEELQY